MSIYHTWEGEKPTSLKWTTSTLHDMIEFDEPKIFDEVVRKAKCCSEQNKIKMNFQRVWKNDKRKKLDQRNKRFNPPHSRNHLRTF